MTTARDIITKAHQRNGVLTKGEALSGDEASDGLDSLNNLIASWSNESLLIYVRLSESFPLVGGQTSYTIGNGGDFNTERPMQIVSAFTRIVNIDYSMKVLNGVQYDDISQKNIQNAWPNVLYYDNNFPLGTIKLYPVPTTGTIHIRSEKQLTSFASLDTDLSFPPGWERALIFNLAVETAGEYGQPVDEATYRIAMDALNKIKTATARNRKMDAYSQAKDRDNIYTGGF